MPWSIDDLKRLVELEAHQQNVDPRLAHAVVSQESEWNPNAVGDNGNSIGLFQLQPGAAKDAGLHPRFRSDVPSNIKAGVTYLKQKLTQSGGNVEQALSRYNRGTPDYRGIGDPNYVQNVLKYYPEYQQPSAQPRQQPGMLSRMASALSPASAEAAARPQAAGTYSDTDVQNALKALQAPQAPSQPQGGTYGEEDIQNALKVLGGTTEPTRPAPPTATSTPEQDSAYRAWAAQQPVEDILSQMQTKTPPRAQAAPQAPAAPRSRLEELEAELARREGQQPPGTQPPAGTTSPAAQPPTEEPITSERRFLDLPSIQQLPLEERTQRFKEFYGLKPELKEEFLRSEEPPSDITVDIEKPSPPASTGWRANLPQTTEEWDRRMAPMRETTEATSRAAIPMALSAVPGGLAYALGTKIAPALGAIGKVVPPLLEAAGGYLGHRANVKLGHEKEGALGDVLSLLPLAVRTLGAGTAGWLERTISEAPVAARDQTMDLLSKLFSRGGAQGTLTYLLSGDPQLATWVGGSYATARSLLGFALRHPIGKQLVEQTLKAGRAIGGAELGMLLQIGRTGKASAPVPTQEQGTP